MENTGSVAEEDESLVLILGIGFEKVADWTIEGDKPVLRYVEDDEIGSIRCGSPALYAHVIGGKVAYAGKTTQSLQNRLYGYQQPGSAQATNRKCHDHILRSLQDGYKAATYGFCPDSQFYYGDLRIDLAAGLEDALIEKLDPPLNGRQDRTGSPITESAENEHSAYGEQPSDLRVPEVPIGRFSVTLGPTYYEKGYLNPGIDVSEILGEHGDDIFVQLGCDGPTVQSVINRQAVSNGAPRINARKVIADWFHKNCARNEVVTVDILTPHSIAIRHPRKNDDVE
jgi:hypothetical protein